MCFLGNVRIENESAQLFSGGFEPQCLQHSSYDLRLGGEVYVVGTRAPKKLCKADPYVSLPPGQFALLTCLEELSLPRNRMGFITLRNRYKMQGLVNVSGFHVDPTFKGRLVFAVQNVGPSDIRLKFKEPTFTIFFAEVDGCDKDDRESRPGILLTDIQQLGGSSVTLAKVKKDIDTLRTLLFVYGPVAIALLLTLIWRLSR